MDEAERRLREVLEEIAQLEPQDLRLIVEKLHAWTVERELAQLMQRLRVGETPLSDA